MSAPLCVIGDFAWDVLIRTNSQLLTGGDTFGEVMLTPGGSAANVAVWASSMRAGDRVHRQDRPRPLRPTGRGGSRQGRRGQPLRRVRRAPHRLRRGLRRPDRRTLDGVGPRRRLLSAAVGASEGDGASVVASAHDGVVVLRRPAALRGTRRRPPRQRERGDAVVRSRLVPDDRGDGRQPVPGVHAGSRHRRVLAQLRRGRGADRSRRARRRSPPRWPSCTRRR